MHLNAPLSSLTSASALLFTYAQATYLHNDLSFGHNNDRISPNSDSIPNWQLLGKPSPPEILSNKLVLTPPAPGNQRSAVWAEKPLEHQFWTVDLDFRATGPERGGGNLQIWYVKDGKSKVGASSIYTAQKFDGLALVVDQYSGSGGIIRGFLNDGTTDFSHHHNVDGMAFGHCPYSYRNLGRPSRITIQQSSKSFTVSVDGKACFESDKVKLPTGNDFGITAASAEHADSFEIFKFVTTTETHTPEVVKSSDQKVLASDDKPAAAAPAGDIPTFDYPPDAPASQFASSAEQFADLHNRLQSMMKHITTSNAAAMQWQIETAKSLSNLADRVSESLSRLESSLAELHTLSDHLDLVREDVKQTKEELHSSLEQGVSTLKYQSASSHFDMERHVELTAAKGLGLWGMLGVVGGSNAVLAAAYALYKRKKGNSHMKYL
ncbi:uncharacterized protein L3040_006766 [Drepanopeziza brunnea f. sp. 'multigermtubi']|uniref:Legume-like lectin family protein n=1 Tax=Marssonina brunnea f. sp. multigermtubi (strain MB_m1) TaxID=1072389 RepID=K1XZT5_MARBU|nr:legume-like lectin family protein [Drepanopeziza brunnea f. sp. 'multigermtubi' MB_m1]EKD18359.1 legume-like lectin family protein [Drepanopeziza brunnea f. sp. 'multigermtubi' MB_m1]KAJ5039096.1 hypothetical protein L3040_006766 [Drepanopeziza brunnea f. sp. 'multigermtubi']